MPKYVATDVPLTKTTGEVFLIATVCFPDFTFLVKHYLDLYSSQRQLTWHVGTIPEDEIRLKLGGDHGGRSFKFVMQIANRRHPNSLDNTVPICVFECQDTFSSLATMLSMYKEPIIKLQSDMWNGKRTFSLFFFGDYKVLWQREMPP